MSCLDSNSSNFNTLPPHFTRDLKEPIISKAFHMTFKIITKILDEKDIANLTGLLLRCLALVIYYSEKIKIICKIKSKTSF